MKFKIKIKPKISYYVSILVSSIILFYFAYKGVVAYLIHRELYGGGLDTLVLLTCIYFRNNASFNTFIYSVYKNT